MTIPKMIKAEGDGINIQLAIWEGEGETIFCIPGILANSRSFDLVASILAPKYHVIAMDKRGRGLSDRPETGYSLNHHVSDIHCVLDDLDINKVSIIGSSLGAMIGIIFASEFPQYMEKLILVDGGGELPMEELVKVGSLLQPAYERLEMIFPSTDAYLNHVKEGPLAKSWSQAMEENYRHDLKETEDGVRSRTQLAHIQEEIGTSSPTMLNISEYYPKIQCPTLILRASRPFTEGVEVWNLPEKVVERMLKEIPNAKRVDIDTTHIGSVFHPCIERDRAILDFLKSD